jgi:hypothetical protein
LGCWQRTRASIDGASSSSTSVESSPSTAPSEHEFEMALASMLSMDLGLTREECEVALAEKHND